MIDFSEITEQKISEKYNGLPQDLKDVLSSTNTSVVIENIAAKYRLDEKKTTMLIQLVGLVILGFVSFEDMKEEMKETIDISPQFIPLVADEIYQRIFSPVIKSMQMIQISKPATPVIKVPTPTAPVPAPTAIPPRPVAPPTIPTPTKPIDQYREPTFSMPEVVDLRKAPPAVSKVEPPPPSMPPKPLPPKPMTVPPAPTPATVPAPTPTPKPVIPTPPLTFTRPIPITPLIEAEPHQIPTPAHTAPIVPKPQYIMRPSGLPPTDLPDNVLDLRKDKGEF